MIHNCCSWLHCHLLHGSILETKQLSKSGWLPYLLSISSSDIHVNVLTCWRCTNTLRSDIHFFSVVFDRITWTWNFSMNSSDLLLSRTALSGFCWGTGGATLSLTQLGYPSAPPVELELFLVLQASVECSTLWLWASLRALLKTSSAKQQLRTFGSI